MGTGKLQSKVVAQHTVEGDKYDVQLCWQGDRPEDDSDRYYDIYNERGEHLNSGHPWHENEEGVPTREDIVWLLRSIYWHHGEES